MRRSLWLIILVALAAGCQTPIVPLPRAHAHNDYKHNRPLLDALANGFCSIEVDIHLVGKDLLVGHDVEDTQPGRTLQSLYLDPLRERIKHNGGRVYPNGPASITLLIDIKSEGGPTYYELRDALLPYREMLTMTFVDGTINPRPVTIVLTGRVPRNWIAREEVRFVACDGVLNDLDADPSPPAHLVPQVNAKWEGLFTWKGDDAMSDEERKTLRELVAKAHEQQRKLRLWAIPDHPAGWELLYDAGVDFINSDDLPGLRAFLLERQRRK